MKAKSVPVRSLSLSLLFALPCVALLAFGCSEPETIPGVGGNPPPFGAPAGGGAPAGDAARPAGDAAAPAPADGAAAPADGAAAPADGAAAPADGAAAPVDGAAPSGPPPEGGQPGVPPAGGEPPAGGQPGVPAEGGAQQPPAVANGGASPCGDGTCDDAEKADPKLCPRDCSSPPAGGDWCGDGICDAYERFKNNCSKDCGGE